MKRSLLFLLIMALTACGRPSAGPVDDNTYRETNYAEDGPRFKALLLYDDNAEEAHVLFDHQAIAFFRKLTVGEGFIVDSTQNLCSFTEEQLQE